MASDLSPHVNPAQLYERLMQNESKPKLGLMQRALTSLRWSDNDRFACMLLRQADFQDADLVCVRFDGCDLTGVDLTGARMAGCELRACTLDELRGAEALRGTAMRWEDIVAAAGTFADALGIRVLDSAD